MHLVRLSNRSRRLPRADPSPEPNVVLDLTLRRVKRALGGVDALRAI
jgi:hypothetical protein